MLYQQLDEYIKYNRHLIERIVDLKISKEASTHARDVVNTILYRDIVHPLLENRLAGYITFFRNLHSLLKSSSTMLRIVIAERIEENIVGKMLELLASYDCVRIALAYAYRMEIPLLSASEAILINTDSFSLHKLNYFITNMSPTTYIDSGYLIDDNSVTRYMIFNVRKVEEKEYRIGRIKVRVESLPNRNIVMYIDIPNVLDRLQRLNKQIGVKSEVREGLVSYYIV